MTRVWSLDLLWQYLTEMAVDSQGWISATYPKGAASWKKRYAVCMVGSAWYYFFWVFKPQSDIECKLSKAAMCAWKSKKKKTHFELVSKRNVVLLHNKARPQSTRITQEIYSILAGLFCLFHYIHQTLYQVILIFFLRYKIFEWQKLSSRRSHEKVSGIILELETSKILLPRFNKQPDKVQ